MSRKVLINRLAEALKCKPEDIPNVDELTNNNLYWILQHERLHQRMGNVNRTRTWDDHVADKTLNPNLLK